MPVQTAGWWCQVSCVLPSFQTFGQRTIW